MKTSIKIHLQRNTKEFQTLACTYNPYLKGRVLTEQDFEQAIIDGKEVCKKCLYILKIRKSVKN